LVYYNIFAGEIEMQENNDRFLGGLMSDRKNKMEGVFFLITKIIHYLALFLILLAIFSIAVIYPLTENLPAQTNFTGGAIFAFYFASLFWLPFGTFWPKIFNWEKWSPEPGPGLYLNHLARVIIFLIPAGLGYLLGIGGANWSVILPLFIISVILLILIFPTKNKWDRWKWRE
jgi:hypothetical protein